MTDRGQILHQLVLEGNIQRLIELIQQNDTNHDDLCSLNQSRQSIMDVAVEKNHVLVVETLINELKKKNAALLPFFSVGS